MRHRRTGQKKAITKLKYKVILRAKNTKKQIKTEIGKTINLRALTITWMNSKGLNKGSHPKSMGKIKRRVLSIYLAILKHNSLVSPKI